MNVGTESQSALDIRIIYTFIVIRLICRRNPRYSCKLNEKLVPFSVLHTCVKQTFLLHGQKMLVSLW